jgi:hypothetical protein
VAAVDWRADVTPVVAAAGCAVVSAVVAVEVGDDVRLGCASGSLRSAKRTWSGVVSSAAVGI